MQVHPLYKTYNDMLKKELPTFSQYEAVDDGARTGENTATSQILKWLDEHLGLGPDAVNGDILPRS